MTFESSSRTTACPVLPHTAARLQMSFLRQPGAPVRRPPIARHIALRIMVNSIYATHEGSNLSEILDIFCDTFPLCNRKYHSARIITGTC